MFLMTYTEIKKKNNKKYYYRVRTIRDGKKFKKKRIYLGVDLPEKELFEKENESDKKLAAGVKLKGLEKLKPKIVRILKKNKIKRAGIFGSYSKGKERLDSDIDILVDIPKNINLFDVVGIKFKLEDELGKKVDLIEYKLIRPELKKIILNEEIRII